MPEYLGKEGNKLLKLLEEPPENTLFIWVAEEEAGILPTLLSRMQLIKVPPLGPEDIAQALQVRAEVEAQKAWQLASVSDGNYREALQTLQHAEEDWMSLSREWLNTILRTGPVAQVKWVDEVQKLGREKQKQFLRYFIHLLEQSIRLESMGDHVTMPPTENDFATRMNRLCDMAQKEAMTRVLESAVYYIERNAHGKMLFLALTIKFSHIIRDKAIVEVW
jgi:DNA polymerase-3 subunit delta'